MILSSTNRRKQLKPRHVSEDSAVNIQSVDDAELSSSSSSSSSPIGGEQLVQVLQRLMHQVEQHVRLLRYLRDNADMLDQDTVRGLLYDCTQIEVACQNANTLQQLAITLLPQDEGDIAEVAKMEDDQETVTEVQEEDLYETGDSDTLATARLARHRCHICQKTFGSTSALEIHVRTHTGERPYACSLCPSRFSTKGNLKVHQLRHQLREIRINNSTAKANNYLPKQLSAPPINLQQRQSPPNLKSRQPTQCHLCRRVLSCRSAYLMHLKIHSGERPFRCHQCHRTFSTKGNLRSHMFVHNSTTKETASKIQQQQQQQQPLETLNADEPKQASPPMVLGQRNRSAVCKFCSKQLSCRSALEIHMRTHTKERPFRCHLCSKYFSTKGNLKQHLLIHANNNEAIEFFDQESNSLSSFSGAVGEVAAAVDRQSVLPLHRQHPCELCGKVFTSQSALQLHFRTHSGYKPFTCDICHKGFTTKGNMNVHKVKIHHVDKTSVSGSVKLQRTTSSASFDIDDDDETTTARSSTFSALNGTNLVSSSSSPPLPPPPPPPPMSSNINAMAALHNIAALFDSALKNKPPRSNSGDDATTTGSSFMMTTATSPPALSCLFCQTTVGSVNELCEHLKIKHAFQV